MAKFTDVQVGDQVVILPSAWRRIRSLATVERVTATQFVVGPYRFTKSGHHVGADNLGGALVQPATPELITEVEAEQRLEAAFEKLRTLGKSIEARQIEIQRDHRAAIGWTASIESALPHLQSALDALTVRQLEVQP